MRGCRLRNIYILLVFLAGCSYGLVSIFLKLAYSAGFQPDEVVGSQFFIGWGILMILTLLFSRQKVNLKTAGSLILVGLTNGLTGILYSEALQTIPASIGIVLCFQYTWIGIVIEALADRKWPSKEKLYPIPFILMGTILAGGIFEGELHFSMIGLGLALLSALTFALFIFCSGRVATDFPTLPRTLWIVTGVMLITVFVYPPHFFTNGALGRGLGGYGLALALVAVVLPTLLLAKGAPQVGAGMSSILMSSELPVTIIVAGIVLRETISILQWMGVLMILVGLCFPHFYIKRKTINITD